MTISPAQKILLQAAEQQVNEQKMIVAELRQRLSALGAENMENKHRADQAEIMLEGAKSQIAEYERTTARLNGQVKSLIKEMEQLRDFFIDPEEQCCKECKLPMVEESIVKDLCQQCFEKNYTLVLDPNFLDTEEFLPPVSEEEQLQILRKHMKDNKK